MKLIRWVEVHIGRSRRKAKKEKDGERGEKGSLPAIETPLRESSTPATPVRKIERSSSRVSSAPPLSAGSTPQHKHPPSPHPLKPPDTPSLVREAGRRAMHIRTSFLESSAVSEVSSPRQRSRIRTNPWLPSPRSSGGSADNGGWTANRSSSTGSESSESISCTGSVFGSQSSGSLWDGYPGDGWLTGRRCVRDISPSLVRHGRQPPRISLQRTPVRLPVETDDMTYADEERPVTYCRPIPRSSWMDFRDLTANQLDESSDEAYSEDYVHSEEQDSPSAEPSLPETKEVIPQDTGSPQADSACGSDRDNSSCSTTPLSEMAPPDDNQQTVVANAEETLEDKLQRLRLERHQVDERMQEAREEDFLRREERLRLQKELVQYRRLLLLQTLHELKNQLERQGKRLQRAYSATLEIRVDGGEEDWTSKEAELL